MVGFEQATTSLLCDIKGLLQKLTGKDYDEYESLLITVPEDGGQLSLGVGTTKIDFLSGVIIASDGTQTYFQNKLSTHAAEWIKSLYIDVDRSVVFKLDGRSKKTLTADAPAQLNYIKTRWLEITTTQTTNLNLVASSNPDTQYTELKNLSSILDPTDVYGVRKNIGIGELAARLGSIVNFNRRGDVVWMDDFESSTLKWATGGTGTGNSVALSTASAKNGTQSMKLITGDDVNNYSFIHRFLPYPILGNIGFEYSFALGSNLWVIELYDLFYTGTEAVYGVVRYLPQDDRIDYLDADGNFQTMVSNLDLYEADSLFNTWKLVINPLTQKYTRLFLNDATYDMSNYSLRTWASNIAPYHQARIWIYTDTAANNYAYIDDVIFTQNEPEI